MLNLRILAMAMALESVGHKVCIIKTSVFVVILDTSLGKMQE